MASLSLTQSRYSMNSKQQQIDETVDVMWYSGMNDCYENDMSFVMLSDYLDGITGECDSWQSAH